MKSRENLIKEEIGLENYKIIEQIRKMNSQKGVQAMMPFEVNIK
jgi:protease-4